MPYFIENKEQHYRGLKQLKLVSVPGTVF